MPETEKKKMGRPRVDSTPITLRLAPPLLAWLDAECAKAHDQPSRPEMIRRIVERVKSE